MDNRRKKSSSIRSLFFHIWRYLLYGSWSHVVSPGHSHYPFPCIYTSNIILSSNYINRALFCVFLHSGTPSPSHLMMPTLYAYYYQRSHDISSPCTHQSSRSRSSNVPLGTSWRHNKTISLITHASYIGIGNSVRSGHIDPRFYVMLPRPLDNADDPHNNLRSPRYSVNWMKVRQVHALALTYARLLRWRHDTAFLMTLEMEHPIQNLSTSSHGSSREACVNWTNDSLRRSVQVNNFLSSWISY